MDGEAQLHKGGFGISMERRLVKVQEFDAKHPDRVKSL